MTPDSTRFIARVLGPFIVVVGASVALGAPDMAAFAQAFFQDSVLVFVTGAFTLALGLIILAAHLKWNGLAAIIISVFGIVTTLRGALLLLAPDAVSALTANLVHMPDIAYIPSGIAALIGLYLSFVGWVGKQAS